MADFTDLLKASKKALLAEIKTLQDVPAVLTLRDGRKVSKMERTYRFEGGSVALRFAEQILARTPAEKVVKEEKTRGKQAENGDKKTAEAISKQGVAAELVSLENQEVVLKLEKDYGERIPELELEWENDFVPRKTLEEIEFITGNAEARKKSERLVSEEPGELEAVKNSREQVSVITDGLRNPSQLEAIEKAMDRSRLLVWGPPGTGKTATLGYIAANFLNRGKRVLFASNTNRAVDVGLKSILHALRSGGVPLHPFQISRYGECVLEDDELLSYTFDTQIEKRQELRREEVREDIEWLAVLQRLEQRMDGKLNQADPDVIRVLDALEERGGREEVEARVEDALHLNERNEFRKRRLIATTLAKVCTSELFRQREFDVVIVDEASMANIPALLVLASHAGTQLVITGDPMQLPPISVAEDEQAREFMEQDIFTWLSGANSTADLFAWHDRHPEDTAFFDTQYRMKDSLARVISSVFYEGRLRSAVDEGTTKQGSEVGAATSANVRGFSTETSAAFHLVDTSPEKPFISIEDRTRGFRPSNPVHMKRLHHLIIDQMGRGIRMAEIGVIVPFRHSVYEIGRYLSSEGLRDVEVGTIHTFQGREKSVIFFDTVMSGENGRHYTVRPLDETKNANPIHVPRLLNVACSRSKKELYILADMEHIQKLYRNKFLGKLLVALNQ